MRKTADPVPPTPAFAIRRTPSLVTCSHASTEVTRIVQVRLAATTATTRVRRSLVHSQHTKPHPGVTHNVTRPIHTAAVVPLSSSAVAAPTTALTRPTEAVASRSSSASSALRHHAAMNQVLPTRASAGRRGAALTAVISVLLHVDTENVVHRC